MPIDALLNAPQRVRVWFVFPGSERAWLFVHVRKAKLLVTIFQFNEYTNWNSDPPLNQLQQNELYTLL